MTNNTDPPVEDYLDKVSKQKAAYKELDKFEPGQSSLQYFPVPVGEWKAWKKEKDKKDLEEYEKKQKSKLDVLAMREELTRGNGHDKPQVKLNEGNPTMTTCNDCGNTVGTCDCMDNPKWAKIAKGESERYPSLHMPGKKPVTIPKEQIDDKIAKYLKGIIESGNILDDTIEKKYPNVKKAATFESNKVNPDHCDLKKPKPRAKKVNKKK